MDIDATVKAIWHGLMRVKCLRETAMPIAEMHHFEERTQQGETTVKERRELLEAHRRNVSLELQEMQRTLALIDAKIVHDRSLESEQSATAKELLSSSRRKHHG
jgi:DNA-binding transcriptional MerR regulator